MRAVRKGALGALLFFIVFLFALFSNSTFSIMGNQSAHVTSVVQDSYKALVIGFGLRILLVYLLTGFLMGIWAHFLLGPVLGRTQFYFAAHLLLVATTHGLLYFRSMLMAPQMFSPTWYEAGGLWRLLQDLVCQKATATIFNVPLLILVGGTVIVALRRIFAVHKLQVPGVIVLIAAAGFAALARHNADRPVPYRDRNVLLIGSDSMRRDYLSATSNLRAFSKDAVCFENMLAPVARTFPSFVSLLTGMDPNTHGIVHMFPAAQERRIAVPALPGILRDKGYASFVVTDFVGDIFSRCDLGFEKATVPEFNLKVLIQQRMLETHTALLPYVLSNPAGRWIFPVVDELACFHDSGRLTRKAISAMRRLGSQRPFMGLVFLGEPHFPYAARWPYYKGVRDPGYSGPYKYRKDNRVDRSDSLSAGDVDRIRDLYAAAVANSDMHLGRILDFLRESGLDKKTLVVVFSDHGENLYESGRGMGHGDHLSGALAQRMVCMIRNPFKPTAGRSLDKWVSGIDLAPTILDALGFAEGADMEGRSLRPLMETGFDPAPRPVFCETGLWFAPSAGGDVPLQRYAYPDVSRFCEIDRTDESQIVVAQKYLPLLVTAKHRCMVSGGRKLIYKPRPDRVEWELYDIRIDSLERHPLALDNLEADALKMSLLRSYADRGKLVLYQERVLYDPLLAY